MRNDFETGYLMHWGIKKGGKKENHKYYERVEKNGKYLYFYTQAEYEAWLNKGNKALDKTKNKAKGALSSLKSRFSNTKSSLLNAIGQGRSAAYQLANRSQTQLTKKNAQKAIDRGNKIISSILNTTQKQVSNKASSLANSVQKNSKAVSTNVSKKANSIVSKVTNTLKKAGKDTAKAVQKYISKGEKTIKQTLAKAGNVKLGSGTAKAEKAGSPILASVLATVAAYAIAAAAIYIAPKVVKKAKELINKIFHPETTITTKTSPKEVDTPKEKPPKDFASDAKDSYKEDRAQHSDVPQKDSPTTRDDDMAAVNPNYKSEEDRQRQEELVEDYYAAYARGDMAEVERIYDEYMKIEDKYAGYTNNCMNCTLIYDLRRRGYDVDAPWNPNGTVTASLFDWYDVSEDDFYNYGTGTDRPISKSEAKDIKNFIKDEYPEGSYGHLNLTWAEGGGHDCVWSIENGEVIIRDCQSNEVVKFEDYVTESISVNWVRTDDKALKDLAYEVATADKANVWGEADRDEYEDDIYDTQEYNVYVEDDGQETFKNDKDLVYDEYWRKAAGKKRK